ncbi:MAG TPA: hypothetical protein VHX38_25765 [Pseudonocardiaceae bacterium]|jgi:hypothetical protein|nr:hypothetical protein [Pseudonocardiaceae bacterium]
MDDLRRIFGERFLSYVLACDSAALDGAEWSAEQQHVVQQLTELAGLIAGQHPSQQRNGLTNVLLDWRTEVNTSLANLWRLGCGGQILDINATTDIGLTLILQIARDMYPGFLLPTTDSHVIEGPGSDLSGPVHRHPARLAFCQAVVDDEKLRLLFPGVAEGTALEDVGNKLYEIQSEITVPAGRSGSFQLVMLCQVLLNTAYDRLLLSGRDTLEAYLDVVAEVLDDTRKLGSGGHVTISVVFGLANVHLPESASISLPWGVIRSPTEGDQRFLIGETKATAVLVAQVPWKILRKVAWKPEPTEHMVSRIEQYRPAFEQWSRDAQRVVDLTRYALLCASKDTPYFAARHVSTIILDPLHFAPHLSWPFVMPASAPETTLDADALHRVEHWAGRLKDHPRTLDIAVRRTLSAIADRLDPLDGFIDAVLAWENMFSDTPETTLKVCGAIAILLEREDLVKRAALFKELQELYRKRSKVVHGSQEPSMRETIEHRDRAIVVGLDAMRRLYDYPSLLPKDSSVRGRDILLGGLDDGFGSASSV